MRVILFLWVTTNLGEMNINTRQRRALMSLPTLPDDKDTRLMVRDEAGPSQSGNWVICLNRISKMLLFVLVYVPKRIIVIALIFSGSCWLLATEHVADLILNSLALAFVVEVDELIASTFFPDFFIEQLSTLAVALPQDPNRLDKEKEATRKTWAFARSALFVLGTLAFVEFMMTFQPVLPGFKFDVASPCARVLEEQVPWCWPWQKEDCFPHGKDD